MTSVSIPRQARRCFVAGLLAAVALSGCQTRGVLLPPQGEVTPDLPRRPGLTHHQVALLVPLTGEDSGVSTSISRAAQLALLDSGNEDIRLTVYDSGKAGAAAAATQAIAEGNQLILGPLLSEEARIVGPIARRSRIPVISFSNDQDAAGDGVFIMGTVPAQAVERVISFARARGASRFGALVPTNLYGQRAARAFVASVQRAGGAVGAVQTYDGSAASLRTAVATLNSKGPFDAVLIGDGPAAGRLAAPLLRPGSRILGTELWASDRALGRAAALRGAWYAAVPNERFDQLVTRYRSHYGKIPYRLGSLGYDAALLAVRSARNWRLGDPFPSRRLLERDGFAGVDGIFRFGRDGIAERALEIRQVTAGGTTTVAPAATSFAN